jgi:hypothetical protein
VASESLLSTVAAKITLNAAAVDSYIPPLPVIEGWVNALVPAQLVHHVIDAIYEPASGYVAYDTFEDECCRAAQALSHEVSLPDGARRRFVREAVFFSFGALDIDKKSYYFNQYPIEVARQYLSSGSVPELAARRERLRTKPWHRRLHRQWARQELETGKADHADAKRILLTHRMIGTARDFDEEKRRLNTKLWRALFTLSDGLGVSLAGPLGGLRRLCSGIDARVVWPPMDTDLAVVATTLGGKELSST